MVSPTGGRWYHEAENVQGARHLLDPDRHPSATLAFCLDPDTLTQIIQRRRAGWRLAVIYHSHTNGLARLSRQDIQQACNTLAEPVYPGTDYVIVAIDPRTGTCAVVAFRWVHRTRAFQPVPVQTGNVDIAGPISLP